jgi:excisionase family DNA binding protein
VQTQSPILLTVEEVASQYLRTSRKGVWAMAQRGLIPGVVRIGRRLLFRRDKLLEFIRENSVPSPQETER